MTGSRLKSELKNPYQKKVNRFWLPQGRLHGYSDSDIETFELKAALFERNMKYIQWEQKPNL